jgi:hypothetical protein
MYILRKPEIVLWLLVLKPKASLYNVKLTLVCFVPIQYLTQNQHQQRIRHFQDDATRGLLCISRETMAISL